MKNTVQALKELNKRSVEQIQEMDYNSLISFKNDLESFLESLGDTHKTMVNLLVALESEKKPSAWNVFKWGDILQTSTEISAIKLNIAISLKNLEVCGEMLIDASKELVMREIEI
ncbi:MAG: hypothetical protein ACXWVZ_04910 [Kaistella sp.]